jgi:hypothetical protein
LGAASERRVFPVRGADLIARGLIAGPGLGQALRALEDWWLACGFPDKHVVLARLNTLDMDLQSGAVADDNDAGDRAESGT